MEDQIAAYYFAGSGAIPANMILWQYRERMHCTPGDVAALLRDAPGQLGRDLFYMRLQAETPRREHTI